jgi:hypothetical protein
LFIPDLRLQLGVLDPLVCLDLLMARELFHSLFSFKPLFLSYFSLLSHSFLLRYFGCLNLLLLCKLLF